MNVSISKQDSNCADNRPFGPVSSITKPIAKETYGQYNVPQKLDMNIQNERNRPEILDAFRKNPYTQSLTTSV